jgi:rare lipoprotein A
MTTRPSRALAVLAVLSLVTVGCAGPQPARQSATNGHGVASWYGKQYHGRKTASGEPFNMNALTAAHRTHPFGTTVRVTNLDNGKDVVVRINDRGPYAKGRVIDLSYAAAKRIGMVEAGVADVRLEVVTPGRRVASAQ